MLFNLMYMATTEAVVTGSTSQQAGGYLILMCDYILSLICDYILILTCDYIAWQLSSLQYQLVYFAFETPT